MTPSRITDGRRLLLASKSPRRRELLSMLDIPFQLAKDFECDESSPDTLSAQQVPIFLSRLKSETYPYTLCPGDILLTADTVVISDGKVLGKPADRKDAVGMLRLLSGRRHSVVTGVTLRTAEKIISFSDVSYVTFREMDDDEIEYYVTKYNPVDKAGAYGIQEWIGAAAISSIEGSYYNIVGLPTEKLYSELLKI